MDTATGSATSAPYGRIEFAYSEMAKAAGLDMMPCLLLAEGPRRHFMTKRFDRGAAGERFHVISLCALANLDYNLVATHSYDQYLQSVKALGLEIDDLARGLPADGLQRHGGEPRRPHQELRLHTLGSLGVEADACVSTSLMPTTRTADGRTATSWP